MFYSYAIKRPSFGNVQVKKVTKELFWERLEVKIVGKRLQLRPVSKSSVLLNRQGRRTYRKVWCHHHSRRGWAHKPSACAEGRSGLEGHHRRLWQEKSGLRVSQSSLSIPISFHFNPYKGQSQGEDKYHLRWAQWSWSSSSAREDRRATLVYGPGSICSAGF